MGSIDGSPEPPGKSAARPSTELAANATKVATVTTQSCRVRRSNANCKVSFQVQMDGFAFRGEELFTPLNTKMRGQSVNLGLDQAALRRTRGGAVKLQDDRCDGLAPP